MSTQNLTSVLTEQNTLDLWGAAYWMHWLEVAPESDRVFTRAYHLGLMKVYWCQWVFQNNRLALRIGKVVVPYRDDFVFFWSRDHCVLMKAQVWNLAFVSVNSIDRRVFLSYVMVDYALVAWACAEQVRLVCAPVYTRDTLCMLFESSKLLAALHVVNRSVTFLVANDDCFSCAVEFNCSH